VSPSKTVAPGRLLAQVAGERQTGALVVRGHPGGAVYVLEGRVIYAESPAAPGVGELLTASGRLAGRTWQNALDRGTATARVGRMLVEHGHLTQGELELCVLGATYDAAYFALAPQDALDRGTATARVGRMLVEHGHLTQGELELCVLGATYDAAYFALAPQDAPADFLGGATHWLGPVVHIDPAAVTREVRRRAKMLDDIFPDPRVDTEVVTPITRPPRERITLTAPQWELLVHADGQRTPADLAFLLGKAGFATIQELRRLAAAGLLDLPGVRDKAPEFVRLPRSRGTAVDAHRPQLRPDNSPTVPVVSGVRPAAPDPPAPTALTEETSANGTVYRPPRLARRKPGAKLPKELAGDAPPHTGTDEVLLKRIRTALRALR